MTEFSTRDSKKDNSMFLKIVRIVFYLMIAVTASGLIPVAVPSANVILSVAALILTIAELSG
jgi:hypothetical protein